MRKSEMSSVEYRNKFTALNYDRLSIFVPKGRKRDIKDRADKQEMTINGYVTALLQADLGLSDEEWKQKENDNE